MQWLLDEPSVVLVCATVAALLLIVEVALPTIGVAGTLALLCGGLAAAGIVDQDATWWPLLGPALAVATWSAVIVRQRRSAVLELLAAGAFAAGGALFAIVNDDSMSMVVTAAGTPLLAFGFPRLHDAATLLVRRPAQVGMDALVGTTATVDRWDGDAGIVVLQGARWNARSPGALGAAPGTLVTVIGYTGSTVTVTGQVDVTPWGPPLVGPYPSGPPSTPPYVSQRPYRT